MASDALGRRYAEALLDNIKDPETLDRVNEELRVLAEFRSENQALRAFFMDPSVTEKDRLKLVHTVFEGKVQPVLMNFLDLLVHKHRLADLDNIARAFFELVEERRNQARVKITTAIPLPADIADRMKRALDVVTGKECILESRVDPRVIGGAVGVYGDSVLDGSVRTALDELRKQLLATDI